MMDKYISLINEPILQTILAIVGVLGAVFLAFQKVQRPDYSFHKDRYNLVKDFLDEFERAPKRNLAIEELFSILWSTKRITYPEIVFLMQLNSPRYFMNLYVKAKGYVEVKENKIQVTTKYGVHSDGLKKEKKSLMRFYFVMGGIVALLLPTLLVTYPKLETSTIASIAFLILILIAGMGIALFEVNRVYSAERLLEEYFN